MLQNQEWSQVDIFLQSELLELFCSNNHAAEHVEVTKFASGLSEQIGTFLCQYLFPGKCQYVFPGESGVGEHLLFGCLRENELFSQDLFQKVPPVKWLNLCDLHMSSVEVQSLSDAIKAGRLPQLMWLDLSCNNLTDCLKNLFGGPDHPSFPSLEGLDLSNTHLNQEDVESLTEAVGAGKLPQLKHLNLSNKTLTGCLKALFGGPDHPGFLMFGGALSDNSPKPGGFGESA